MGICRDTCSDDAGELACFSMSECVCSLCTPDGELVKHKSELQAGGYYVAVGFGAHFRLLDYGVHTRPAFNPSPRYLLKYVLCVWGVRVRVRCV